MAEDRSRAALPAAVGVALRAFVLSRVVVLVSGVTAVALAGVRADNASRYDAEGLTRPFGALGDALVAPFARWDAVWFLRIADGGYDDERAAFFPLFPLLSRGLGLLFGSTLVAGIAISLAALLVALVLLHRLVALDFGAEAATLTVLLVAVSPGALWFGAVYSEALFLALSVGAIYAARTDRWTAAAIAGAFAAATRSAGLILLVPLVLLWWRSPGRRPADLSRLAVVPVGLALYCAGLALAGEDGLAPFRAQEAWDRTFAGPLMAIPEGVSAGVGGLADVLTGAPRPAVPFDPAALDAMLLAVLVAVLVALVGAMRRLPPAYWAYAAAALLLPLSFPVDGQPLMSLPRFAAVLWPLHLWLALWLLVHRAAVRQAVVAASLVLLAAASWFVSTWHWIA